MEKEIKSLTTNLLWILMAYIATIIFNLQLFSVGTLTHLLYGLTLLCLGGLTFYCLALIKKGNFKTSATISIIIGPIMTIMSLVEGFTDLDLRFIQNVPFTGWIFIICGIIILVKGLKIKKNNSEY